MGALLCSTLRPDRSVDPGVQRYLAQLEADFDGALGMAEGLLANDAGHSMEQVARLLDRARVLMPHDARKSQKAAWFELNAYLRLDHGDVPGATSDLEAAVALQPYAASRAAAALTGLYQRTNDAQALARLQERLVR
jgi:hypothetical protein